MGDTGSKQEILNETLNNITMNVLTTFGASQNINVKQSNDIILGGGTEMNGVKIENVANIDLAMLAGASNNARMQNELTSQLDAALKNSQDAVGKASSDAKVHNIVKNNVAVNLNSETLLKQSVNLSQENKLFTEGVDPKTGRRTVIKNTNVANKADIVSKLVSNVSSGILSELKADSKATGTAESTQTNPISTAVGALKDVALSVTGTVGSVLTKGIGSGANIAMVLIVMLCITVAYLGPEFILGTLKQLNPMNMLSDDPPAQAKGGTSLFVV